MKPVLVIVCLILACRADPLSKDEAVSDSAVATDSSSSGPVEDSGQAPAPPDTPIAPGPEGSWLSCYGQLTIGPDAFSWQPNGGACTVKGDATYSDPLLILTITNGDECSERPWWLSLSGGLESTFSPTVIGSRLALFPQTSPPTTRLVQFEESLDVESWSLTNNEGVTSTFELCWVEGAFFGGRYRNTEGSCDFLSCGGRIVAHALSDRGEHWTTTCEGSCPCSGVVTVSERTEDTLGGDFFGSNCARTMSGTFSGTLASP